MKPEPSISINTTNDTVSITLTTPDGAHLHIHQIKLGETGAMTMDQVDARARIAAKEALAIMIEAL